MGCGALADVGVPVPWEGGKSTTFENTQYRAGKAKSHKLLLLVRGREGVVKPPCPSTTAPRSE